MERYNILNRVHKGLKAFLYDRAIQAQQTDFTNVEEAVQTLDKIGEAMYLFGQHALYVERLLFPFVVDYNPGLISSFKAQYQAHAVLAQRMRGLLIAYEHAVSDDEKHTAGHAIQKAFTGFVVAHLESMAREDGLLNSLLWRHYSDAELLTLEREIVAKLPPKDLALLSKWIVRGMNNREIIQWLRAIEQTYITSIFSTFFNSAAQELPENRWVKIQEALAEGVSIPDAGVRT